MAGSWLSSARPRISTNYRDSTRRDHQRPAAVEPHPLDDALLEPQQPTEYPALAHAAPRPSGSRPRQPETVGLEPACVPSGAHGNDRSAPFVEPRASRAICAPCVTTLGPGAPPTCADPARRPCGSRRPRTTARGTPAMSLSRRGGHYPRAENEGGTDLQTIITLPIEERARAHRFYIDALGLEPVGEPWKDGIPEPLEFKLGDGVNLMFIPRKGFGWVLGEQPAAKAGLSECLLQYSCDEDDEVDVVIERAEKAGATVVLDPRRSPGATPAPSPIPTAISGS